MLLIHLAIHRAQRQAQLRHQHHQAVLPKFLKRKVPRRRLLRLKVHAQHVQQVRAPPLQQKNQVEAEIRKINAAVKVTFLMKETVISFIGALMIIMGATTETTLLVQKEQHGMKKLMLVIMNRM